ESQAAKDSAHVDSATVQIAPLARAPARTWGAAIGIIDSAAITASTASTLSELLQARLPGVSVFRSGGLASEGSLVSLRGPNAIVGSHAPLVIVDGVRLSSLELIQPVMDAPTRLDDIVPEDIERIEVLNPAAAALYGDGAANGAIMITTRRGSGGGLRLDARADTRMSRATEPFPLNYRRTGVSPSTGQPVSDCSLLAIAQRRCTPTGLAVWDPFAADPFRMGQSSNAHLALSGTALGTSIYASAVGRERAGVQS